jgi:5-methylcytosine-specific restriction protein B
MTNLNPAKIIFLDAVISKMKQNAEITGMKLQEGWEKEAIDKIKKEWAKDYYVTTDESGKEIMIPIQNKEQIILHSINDLIKKSGFTFSLLQITNYYLSLKTKPFVILTGISGTGKTKITELFAKAVCEDFEKQYLLLPVRPDWNDDRNLIGYYNPLTKQYQTTPFLDFIMKAAQDPENPYFVCLDEMNLARVEYYFSTFLSAMESGSKEISLSGFNGDMEYKTSIPSNLFFTGTVNMDETTYRFSPKVLDRANTIEFHEIDLLKSR